MQIYNALPRLTAQPDDADKSDIPHRLYAFLPPTLKYSAQQWRDDVIREITAAKEEGLHPVIVGGTGLYIKALVEGFSPMPDIDPEIREAAIALQQRLGNPGFHAALAKIDPQMAARLNPNDTQRLIRAYEVITATGQSLAEWQSAPVQGPPAGWRFDVTILTPPRDILHQRCDRRFDAMVEGGVLDEIAAHLDLPDDALVTHALGFRPLRDFLKGLITRDDAIARAKAETRQYAKRQDTWFRHQIAESSQVTVKRII